MLIRLILIALCLHNTIANASAASSSSSASGSGSAASASSSSANMEVVKAQQDIGIYGTAEGIDIRKVSFSPDGKYLAVITSQTIDLFEVQQETGYLKLKKRVTVNSTIHELIIHASIAWSGNGRYLVCVSSRFRMFRVAQTIHVLDLRTGEEYSRPLDEGPATGILQYGTNVYFSSNSKWLLLYGFLNRNHIFTQDMHIFAIEKKKIVAKKLINTITFPPRTIATEANLTMSPTMNIFIINYPDLSIEPPYNVIGGEVFELGVTDKATVRGLNKLTGNVLDSVKIQRSKKKPSLCPQDNDTATKQEQTTQQKQPNGPAQPSAQPRAVLTGPVKDVQFSPNGTRVAFAREMIAKKEFWVEIDIVNQETGFLTAQARMLCGKKIPLMVWARDGSFFAYSSDGGINLVLFNKKKRYTQTLDVPFLESLAVSPDGKWLLAYGLSNASPFEPGQSELLRIFAIDKDNDEAPLQSKQQISEPKMVYVGRSALTFSPTMNLFVISYTNHLGIKVFDFNDSTGAIRLVKQGQPLAGITARMQSALPSHMKEVSSILDEYIAGKKPLEAKTETESAAGPSTATGMFGNDSLIRAIQSRNFPYALAIAQKMTDEQIVLKNNEIGKSALDLMLTLKNSIKESEKKAYDELILFLQVKESDANPDQANDTKKAGEKRKR